MSRMRSIVAGVMVACVLGVANQLVRAEAELEAENPETYLRVNEIVVLGTRVENKIKNITSSVSAVDLEQMEASSADYVMSAIASEPGVYVRRDNIYGRQDLSIRGLGSNMRRVQVLIDGRPEKMSMYGCTVAQTLPLANVERVEVLRGPESVLYGSDAMGGVVNITTRRQRDPGFDSGFTMLGGSYGTWQGVLHQGGKVDAFDYYAVYDHKQTDGHRANSRYQADFGYLRLGMDLDQHWRLEGAGQYFVDLGHDPGPVNNVFTNNDRRIYERLASNLRLEGQWDDTRISLSTYHNYGCHKFNLPTIQDFWHSKDATFGAKAEFTQTVFENDDWKIVPTVGYEYQYLWAKPQDSWVRWARENMPARFMQLGSSDQHNNDAYIFNELTWGNWVNTLGLRAHVDNERTEPTWLPHVGLLRHLTESTTLRTKAARGFRQPRFSELYLFPAHVEDLKPEDIWGFDVGLIQEFGSYASLEVTPFYQHVRNMIETLPNDNPPPQVLNQNSGKFDMRGVEVALELRPLDQCRVNFSYTYTDIDNAPEGNRHANRQGVPENEFNITAEYTVCKLRLSAEMLFIAGLYDSSILSGGAIGKVANYWVANVKAAYPVCEHAEIFGGIDNLFDYDYEQIPGYPMPGITLYAGLRTQF